MTYLATYYYIQGRQTGVGNVDVTQNGGICKVDDVRSVEKLIAKTHGFDRVVLLNLIALEKTKRGRPKGTPVPLSTRRCRNCAMRGKCDIYEMGFTEDDFCSWWEDEEEE